MQAVIGKISTTLLIISATILLASSCGGNANSAKQTEKVTPTLQIQSVKISPEALSNGLSDTLRFGVMRQGEQVIKDLRLENVAATPMVLLRHVTSCGCVNIEYDRKPIAPQQSCNIHFTYDSRGQQGWQMKLLEFYFADSATPLKIYIDAEVE